MNLDAKAAQAYRLLESGKEDDAWYTVRDLLCHNPNHIGALATAAKYHQKVSGPGVAYNFYKRLADLAPNESATWVNYGRVAQDLWRTEEAIEAYRKGLAVAERDDSRAALHGNWSALCIDHGDFEEGEEQARLALQYNPESKCAQINLGFCQLAKHQWEEGWKNYHKSIGIEWRPKVNYKDEPEWDGTEDQRVVLYGDQGIGDEICFASMVPDIQARCRKLTLDIDHRLVGLFKRSFPGVTVYGTRHKAQKWDVADRAIDASLPLGQIGEFVRLSDESFRKEPYLKADPERVEMWKALFAKKGKPVIGIAWSGGIMKTGAAYRRLTLDQLRPLLSAIDAHWVSLQYQSAGKEIADFRLFNDGIDIREYPHATLTNDYDDTCALIAACDLIVSVPTAVVHAAGGLGVPCITMKSAKPCWKFYKGLIWHQDVKLIENDGWENTIKRTAEAVCAHFGTEVREEPDFTQIFHVKGSGNGVALNA